VAAEHPPPHSGQNSCTYLHEAHPVLAHCDAPHADLHLARVLQPLVLRVARQDDEQLAEERGFAALPRAHEEDDVRLDRRFGHLLVVAQGLAFPGPVPQHALGFLPLHELQVLPQRAGAQEQGVAEVDQQRAWGRRCCFFLLDVVPAEA